MRIQSFPRIRRYRAFGDFQWPAQLQEFGQFNVLYGWNGSGKTTLSEIFRALEKTTPIEADEVKAKIDNAEVDGATFGPNKGLPRVKVFNRSFVEESVFSTAGTISPIYFVGRESKEKQEEVQRLKALAEEHKAQLAKLQNKFGRLDKELREFCSQQARLIKELLRSSGQNPYNNFESPNFRATADALRSMNAEERATYLISETEKDALRSRKDAKYLDVISPISLTFPDCVVLSDGLKPLLEEAILSASLPELTSNAALQDWIEAGLAFHGLQGTSEGVHDISCKFCTQPVPARRIEELKAHFSDLYEARQNELDSQFLQLEAAREEIDLKRLPDKRQLFDHLWPAYETLAGELLSEASKAGSVLAMLADAIERKRRNLHAAVALSPEFAAALSELNRDKAISALNGIAALIAQHNAESANFATMVADARERLEKGLVAEKLEDYIAKIEAISNTEGELTSLAIEIQEVESRTVELEKEVLEHRAPAEELNGELAAYLGRSDLKFELSGTGYAITRAGQPATNLSEGERTAISFLHFLKSLQDRQFVLATDIVVIDDPVSSLDTNSLFSAFAYMKERTKTAGQLFILTHNFQFFRQIKNWYMHINGGPKGKKTDARYFMLESRWMNGERSSAICQLDTLLWEYESEYHYLFKKVYEGSRMAAGSPLETYYLLPNIARRLLEAFLSFRYPNDDGLRSQLDRIATDPATRARVLRFVHTYSHESTMGEDHDPTVLAETPAILANVLELIQNADPQHYAEMNALLGIAP